jgi:hypothetical protein
MGEEGVGVFLLEGIRGGFCVLSCHDEEALCWIKCNCSLDTWDMFNAMASTDGWASAVWKQDAVKTTAS